MTQNPNCDGLHCRSVTSDVRILPLGSGAQLHLCLACFEVEMKWRRETNEKFPPDRRYDIPLWHTLEFYQKEGTPCEPK